MSAPQIRLLLALGFLAALVLAGCGTAAHRPASAPAAVDGCVRLGSGARAIRLDPVGGEPLSAVMVGTGTTTFVLSNESDENLCSWLPFVGAITARGYSALLYDSLTATDLAADARAAALAARAAGARRVVLMGASVGARASIEAAAARPPGVSAVVSLSAERTVRSDPSDLLGPARHVPIPTLLISAREDPFVNGATRPLLRALPAHHKRALILPGADHGTSLLTDSFGPRVRAAILAFVAAR